MSVDLASTTFSRRPTARSSPPPLTATSDSNCPRSIGVHSHLTDLLAYREAASTERVTALDELTRQAASAGGYDSTAGDYRDALERARSRAQALAADVDR